MPWVLRFQLIIPLSVTHALRVLRTEDRPSDRPFQIGGHSRVVRESITLQTSATITEDLPRVPRLRALRLDMSGGRSSSRYLSCALAVVSVVPTFALTGLFLVIIATPSFALAWFRPVVGITTLVGGGSVVAIVSSRLIPTLGYGRLWRFIAGNCGFVNGVYIASILRAESWHGRRRHAK